MEMVIGFLLLVVLVVGMFWMESLSERVDAQVQERYGLSVFRGRYMAINGVSLASILVAGLLGFVMESKEGQAICQAVMAFGALVCILLAAHVIGKTDLKLGSKAAALQLVLPLLYLGIFLIKLVWDSNSSRDRARNARNGTRHDSSDVEDRG